MRSSQLYSHDIHEDVQVGVDTIHQIKHKIQSFHIHTDSWLEEAWYRARSTKFYANIGDFSSERFALLPVVPKPVFKSQFEDFENKNSEGVVKYYETSGTTGQPTPTRRTKADLAWNYTGVALLWSEIIKTSDRSIILLPSDIAPIGDLVAGCCEIIGCATARAYPFTQGMVTWDRLEAIFRNFQPTVIWCSPGTLLQFTRVLKQRGTFDEVSAHVTKIMLSGEVVTKGMKEALESWWSARVFNASYGSTETGTIAAADANGDLNILQFSFLCEIMKADGSIEPLSAGMEGELIISSLHGYARPFLRLGTGDMVRVLPPVRDLHRLEILGRREETIQIGGKEYLAGDLEDLIYRIRDVTGYLVQIENGEVSRIVLEQLPAGASFDDIRDSAQALLSTTEIDVRIDVVSQLPVTTKSGAGLKNWKKSNVVRASQ
ncbi:AMP-binding protein [Rhizobium pusense]|uniref:phenylacetate--CoA ligase family protein n=1 Tax=Agrobacterium pusense TaxID=648995 RepID=UPI002448FB36|nr:AMP-binding protein [Agrobacterium pusense]MDH1270484.1 AMP-binding protein [Agrobacterium pusense]